MTKEFTVVIKKMKDFFQHDKIQNLIKKDRPMAHMHSRSVMIPHPQNFNNKKETKEIKEKESSKKVVPQVNLSNSGQKVNNKEHIKKKINDGIQKKDLVVETKNLLTSFMNQTEDSSKQKEISDQQVSFRERLNKKKTLLTSSNLGFVNLEDKKKKKKEQEEKERRMDGIKNVRRFSGVEVNTSSKKLSAIAKKRSMSKNKIFEDTGEIASTPKQTLIPKVDINLVTNSVSAKTNNKSSIKAASRFSNPSPNFQFDVSSGTPGEVSPLNASHKPNHTSFSIHSPLNSINMSSTYHHHTVHNLSATTPANMQSNVKSYTASKFIKDSKKNLSNVNNSKITKKTSNSIFVPAAKSLSNKNMVSSEIFYDKEKNSIRVSQKKLIEIQKNLLSPVRDS